MTLQSPTATVIPLMSSSELTGCRYPGLLDRKNRSDMCSRWKSNPRLPSCKASTLSTRPGFPLCGTLLLLNRLVHVGGSCEWCLWLDSQEVACLGEGGLSYLHFMHELLSLCVISSFFSFLIFGAGYVGIFGQRQRGRLFCNVYDSGLTISLQIPAWAF